MADHPFGLQYQRLGEQDEERTEAEVSDFHSPDIDISVPEKCEACTWQIFPPGISWAPEKVEVNGRKGRRVICVLAQDRLHYRVYDLDSSSSLVGAHAILSDKFAI